MTQIISEIPLTPDNQKFNINLTATTYRISIIWRDGAGWVMNLQDGGGNDLVLGIPLVTGADLLEQYTFMGFGFSLFVVCDDPGQGSPTKDDLGTGSHLYLVQN